MLARMIASTLLFAAIGLVLASCEEPGPVPALSPQPQTVPPPAPGPVEASIIPTQNPAAESTVSISESAHTLTGTNLRLADLISVAYRTPERTRESIPLLSALRVVSAQPLPVDGYDVRISVPNGKAQQLRAALAANLERSFGLTVRREMRQAAVLALVAPAGKLDVHRIAELPPEPGTARLTLTGDDLSLLAEQLEDGMQQPVVNDTGLRVPYDLRLRGPVQDGQPQPVPAETARAALREQLGLDLTPALRSIEFLVVENVARTPRP